MAVSPGTSKARTATAFIRARITSGEWAVGAVIPKEPELMELIGVGRSTVREAVRTLAGLGMLETRKGIGTFVRHIVPAPSILADTFAAFPDSELLALRRALLVESARQAAGTVGASDIAQLADLLDRAADSALDGGEQRPALHDFHARVVSLAGIGPIEHTFEAVSLALAGRAGADTSGTDEAGCRRIVAALATSDCEGAGRAMGDHLDRVRTPVRT